MLRQLFPVKAVRRCDAEGRVSLWQRRAWFDDEPDAPDENADDTSGQDAPVDISTLPAAVQGMIKKLRNEAAANRVALKKANDEKAKAQAEAAKREQERLAEQGNYKTLSEQLQAERDGLLPHKQRAETLEAMIRASNDARIAQVPENLRTLIPTELPPEKVAAYLDANWTLLNGRAAPNIDAGAGGGTPGGGSGLTAEEKQFAAGMGVTEEEFAKAKQKAEDARGKA